MFTQHQRLKIMRERILGGILISLQYTRDLVIVMLIIGCVDVCDDYDDDKQRSIDLSCIHTITVAEHELLTIQV